MSRKIIAVTVRTIDDENHIINWTKNDIELDSIKFKIDAKKEKTLPNPKKEPKKDPPKDTKKDSPKK